MLYLQRFCGFLWRVHKNCQIELHLNWWTSYLSRQFGNFLSGFAFSLCHGASVPSSPAFLFCCSWIEVKDDFWQTCPPVQSSLANVGVKIRYAADRLNRSYMGEIAASFNCLWKLSSSLALISNTFLRSGQCILQRRPAAPGPRLGSPRWQPAPGTEPRLLERNAQSTGSHAH
jgi:hypothetical protein